MTTRRITTAAAAVSLPLILAACELGPKESYQLGPAGAGMEQVDNLNRTGPVRAAQVIRATSLEVTSRDGPRARELYPNLQVLGDISQDEFNILMANITEWVVPKNAPESEQGCNYCHNPENMASYEKYTKTVSLKMLQMTQTINTQWKAHVQATGVTCYTCHRGQAVPSYVWANSPDPATTRRMIGDRDGQNNPVAAVGYTTLPTDPFGRFFEGDRQIRVVGQTIHPPMDGGATIQATEATYALMIHMSDAMGVNCTFCHNSRNFGSWDTSRIQRVGSWHGIRMVRETNDRYITPLASVFPARGWDGHARLGPMGDPLKVNCTTCHQGVNKPLGGVSMLQYAPALAERPTPPAATAPAFVAIGARPMGDGTVQVAGVAASPAVVEAVRGARAALAAGAEAAAAAATQ